MATPGSGVQLISWCTWFAESKQQYGKQRKKKTDCRGKNM